MAFFNEIDKKLTMLGQGAIQKTKEVTDTAKITGAIRNLENQRRDCYVELGKIFYSQYKDMAEEQEQILIERLESISKEIIQYQDELSRLKGVICCPNCNSEIPQNSVFCNVCGNKIERKEFVTENMDERKCKKCGNALKEGQIFCMNCGTKIEDDSETELEPEGKIEKVCPQCGERVEEEQSFCIFCGTAL